MTEFVETSTNMIQTQFGYTNTAKLIVERAKVYDKFLNNIVEVLNNQFFNIDTCTVDSLEYFWCKLLKLTRQFEYNNVIYTLTDDELREMVKVKLFNWDGSLNALNSFYGAVFKGRGRIFAVDSQDMDYITYVINVDLTENEAIVFTLFDIFPRPAGIGCTLGIIPASGHWFGFEGFFDFTMVSPITVGFGTYQSDVWATDGHTATYNSDI